MARVSVHLKDVLLTWIFCIAAVGSMPFGYHSKSNNDLFDAVDFLHQYGYLDTSSSNLMDEAHVIKAIKSMQNFAGLKETGVLDEETKALMNSSRCGVPDVQSSRTKRYAIHRWKWPNRVLTWRIHNYGNDRIPKSVIRKTFQRSLQKWSNHTNLIFRQIHVGKPDIWFKFAIGSHGDPSPFKRPWDGVIAHAFYPKHTIEGLAGDIHFNDDKYFTVNSYKGKNLPWVALHEIGHSIGMEHSKVKNSIMYPYYQSYNGHESDLSTDDITGIQALYGKKSKPQPTVTSIPPSGKCLEKISAAFVGANKLVYMFSNNRLFVLDKNLRLLLGPVSVWKLFKGVKSVDAAFQRHDGNTVLFSKKSYYVFSPNNDYVSGPHNIASSFPGLDIFSGKVDAAFIWPKTNALYITKGNVYWRYFPLAKGKSYGLVPGYPKLLQNKWTKLPSKLDAALTWTDGATYLFKGEKYYKLKKTFSVMKEYPKQTSLFWGKVSFCSSANDGLTEGKNSAISAKMQMAQIISMLVLTVSLTFMH